MRPRPILAQRLKANTIHAAWRNRISLRVKELGETLQTFENLKLRDFSEIELIDAGALVTLRKPGKSQNIYFLLAPAAGGLEIVFQNKEITLLSPESPLYEKLLGNTVGTEIESPDFEIVEIC
jgi:transcription elongation GreA/GreB family factor